MMDLTSLFRGAYVHGVTGRAERNEMEAFISAAKQSPDVWILLIALAD